MAVFDLDARRAARAEQQEAPTVRFGGHDYTLPAELPVVFLEHVRGGHVRDALAVLLGDDVEQFLAANPSMQDVLGIAEVYAVDPTKL